MKFLADAGISPKTVAFLNGAGHDAVHVRKIGLQRATDAEIVRRARQEGRIVLTFDLDFGEILALGVADTPSVVIFRLSDETSASVNWRLGAVIAERRSELEAGALIVVEDGRYRMRPLPMRGRSS
jgi:predicted nuclease of predicted toxin-antitoxin system